MQGSSPSPPRITQAVLRMVLQSGIVREDIIGNLSEEFDEMYASRGERLARRWYRRQATGIAIRAVWSRVRRFPRGGWDLHTAGAFRKPNIGGGDLSSFVLDVKYALRSFRSTPGILLAALTTLALGVGANTAMFSVVNGVLLAPLGYPNEDEVVSIWPEKRHSTAMVEEIRENTNSFGAISGIDYGQFTLVGDGEPEVLEGEVVGTEIFDVAGIVPVLGRPFFAEDAVRANGPVVVITHELWTRRFGGDSSLVGRTIDLSGNAAERYEVVGILPENFTTWWPETSLLTPMVIDENVDGYEASYGAMVVARLEPGVTVEAANGEVSGLIPDFSLRHPTQFREARFSPVDVIRLHEVAVRGIRGRLWLMLGAVGVVLLIACTNVANLLLARGIGQRHEIGLRLALGADRSRIARMVFTEAALLAGIGGALGTAFAALTLPLLVSFLAGNLPRTAFIHLDFRVLGFGLAASALCSVLFGVGPAMRASRQHPSETMGDSTRGGGLTARGTRITEAMVTVEMALSVVLVLGAGLMLKSLWRLSEVDPGFDGSRTLTMRFAISSTRYDSTAARRTFFEEIEARVEGLPGVEQVAWSNYLPMFGPSAGIPYVVQGQEPMEGTASIVGSYKLVSADFFDVMQMPLIAGRSFGPEDVDDADVRTVLINQAMARRHWPDNSPLGAMILSNRTLEPFARVAGVVGDIRQSSLAEESDPEFYFVGRQGGYGYMYLLVRAAGDPLALVAATKETIRSVDRDLPILEIQTMADVVERNLGSSKFYVTLFGTFAAVALVLGLVGVYGVMAYAVSRRTREFGIRVALGATARTILVSTITKGMVSVGLGLGIGLMAAVAVSRLLTSILYEVEPTDVTVYLVVAILLGATGLLANVLPALRASRLDPVRSLRIE